MGNVHLGQVEVTLYHFPGACEQPQWSIMRTIPLNFANVGISGIFEQPMQGDLTPLDGMYLDSLINSVLDPFPDEL